MWHGRRDKCVDSWHNIENPETESPKYIQLILIKLQSSFLDWLKVEKCWVWLAFFCRVEGSKRLCCNVVPWALGSLTSLFSSSRALSFSFACVLHCITDLELYREGQIREKWVYAILSGPEALPYSSCNFLWHYYFFKIKS